MSAARLAAYAAIGLSVGSVILSMWFMAALAGKMNNIEEELVTDMSDFRTLEQDIWKTFTSRQGKAHGLSMFARREKRQAPGQCRE